MTLPRLAAGIFSRQRLVVPDPPPAFATPALWFRAGDLTLSDDDAVATWTSRGTIASAATAAGSRRPTYKAAAANGLPTVRYAGAQTLALDSAGRAALNSKTGATIFVVARANPAIASRDLIWFSVTTDSGLSKLVLWNNANGVLGSAHREKAADTIQLLAGEFTLPGFRIYEVGVDLITQAAYVAENGYLTAYRDDIGGDGAYEAGSSAGAFIGARVDNADNLGVGWSGDVADVLIYDRAITPTERAAALEELRDHYTLYTRNATTAPGSWQDTGEKPVPLAGLPVTAWTKASSLGGGSTTRTFIAPSLASVAATDVTLAITNMRLANGNTAKAKIGRRNGSTWDLVGEASFATAVGLVLIPFTTPVAVQKSDVPGIWMQGTSVSVEATASDQPHSRFDAVELTGTGVTLNTTIGFNSEIVFHGTAPYLVIGGDSITGGHTDWYTPFDTYSRTGIPLVPGGDPAFDVGSVLEGSVAGLKTANVSRGSQTWAYSLTAFRNAVKLRPHTVLLAFGVNDVAIARTWSAVEDDLDALAAEWRRSGVPRLAITEILPWTAGNDTQAATIRTWNASLATWTAANGVVLVAAHDAMGQTRGSTGELDDLATAFDKDGVHLTSAGVAAFAALIEAGLGF